MSSPGNTPHRSSGRIKAQKQINKSFPVSKVMEDEKKLPSNPNKDHEKLQSQIEKAGGNRSPSVIIPFQERTITLKKVCQKRPVFKLSEEEKQLTASVKKVKNQGTSFKKDDNKPSFSNSSKPENKQSSMDARKSTVSPESFNKTKNSFPVKQSCVCCKKHLSGSSYMIHGIQGRQINLQDLINKYSGIKVDRGSVCGNCVQMLQNLSRQSKKFYEICQTPHSPGDGNKKSSFTDTQTKNDNEESTLKGKNRAKISKTSQASHLANEASDDTACIDTPGNTVNLVSPSRVLEGKAGAIEDVQPQKSTSGVKKPAPVQTNVKDSSHQDKIVSKKPAAFIPHFEKPVTRRSTLASSSQLKTNTNIAQSANPASVKLDSKQTTLIVSSAVQADAVGSTLLALSPSTVSKRSAMSSGSIPVTLVTSSKSSASNPVKVHIKTSSLGIAIPVKLSSNSTSVASTAHKVDIKSSSKIGSRSSILVVSSSSEKCVGKSTPVVSSLNRVSMRGCNPAVSSPNKIDSRNATSVESSPCKTVTIGSKPAVSSSNNIDSMSVISSPSKVATRSTSVVTTPVKFSEEGSILATTSPFPANTRKSALAVPDPFPVGRIIPNVQQILEGLSEKKQNLLPVSQISQKQKVNQPNVLPSSPLRTNLATPTLIKQESPQNGAKTTVTCPPESSNPVDVLQMNAASIISCPQNADLSNNIEDNQNQLRTDVSMLNKSGKSLVLNNFISSTKGAIVVSFMGKTPEILKVNPGTSVQNEVSRTNDTCHVNNMISILNNSNSSSSSSSRTIFPNAPVTFFHNKLVDQSYTTQVCQTTHRRRKKKRTSKHADHTYDIENPPKKPKQLNKVQLTKFAKSLRYFLCSVCKTAYFESVSLSNHWEEKHGDLVEDMVMKNCNNETNMDLFKCSHCELIFDTDTEFIEHLKNSHALEKLYSCSICEKKFELKRQVQVHLATHFPTEKFHCSECSEEFTARTKLEIHACWLNHTKERIRLGDDLENLGDGYIDELQDGREFPCPMCKDTFPCTNEVIDHWNTVHGIPDNLEEASSSGVSANEGQPTAESVREEAPEDSQQNDFEIYVDMIGFGQMLPLCCLCNMAFDSTALLKDHWDQVHNNICIDTAEDHMELNTGQQKYKCKICASVFNCEVNVRRHLLHTHQIRKPMICVYCNKQLSSKRKMRVHLKIHFMCNFYRCSKCPKQFISQVALLKHSCWEDFVRKKKSDRVTNKKSVWKTVDEKNAPVVKRCSLCRVDFGSSGELKFHWKETHDQFIEEVATVREEPLNGLPTPTLEYQCQWCAQEFKVKKFYERHTERHNVTKRFKCTLCSLLLSTFKLARLHLRVHLAERPYSCDKCDSKFIEKKHLKKHKIVHAGPQERQKFVCEVCGRGFPTNYAVKRHKQVVHDKGGKVFNCNICRKGFLVQSKLDYHMSIHTDNKSHLCNACGKTFKSRANLKSHMRAHNMSTRHTCPICKRVFCHREVRAAHLLVEHKKPCQCGLLLFTTKDALMHRTFCAGFEEATKKYNV